MPFDPNQPFEVIDAPVSPVAPAPKAVPAFDPKKKFKAFNTPLVEDGKAVALSVYPGLQIGSNFRPKDHPLSKKNPDSFHSGTKGAIDAAAIPGMTFDQYVQGYKDAGYDVIEAIDEYKNPSPWATGPHWHVVLGKAPTPEAPQEDPQEAPQAAAPVQATPPKPIDQDASVGLRREDSGTLKEGTTGLTGQEQEQQNWVETFIAKNSKTSPFNEVASAIEKRYPGFTKAPGNFAAVRTYYNDRRAGGKTPMNWVSGKREDEPSNPEIVVEGKKAAPYETELTYLADHYKLAAQTGFGGVVARAGQQILNPDLTSEQIAEAQRAVREELAAKIANNPTDETLGGQLAGFGADILGYAGPEYLLPGAIGESVLSRGVSAAAINAGADAAYQGADIAAGVQDEFSPTRGLVATVAGTAFQGIMEGLGKLIQSRVKPDGTTEPGTVSNPSGYSITILPDRLTHWNGKPYQEFRVSDAEGNIVSDGRVFDNGNVEYWGDVAPDMAAMREARKTAPRLDRLAPAEPRGIPRGEDLSGRPVDPELKKMFDQEFGPEPVNEPWKTKAGVDEKVAELTSGWKNTPKFEIAEKFDDLPDAQKLAIMRDTDGNPQDVKAFVAPDGTVHAIADHLEGPEDIPAMVYHEALGHVGLSLKFGKTLDVFLDRAYKTNPTLRQEVDDWVMSGGQTPEGVDPRLRATEEVLAERSESGPFDAGTWDKIKNIVKEYARKAGLKNLAYSDREIKTILAMAHSKVIGGGRNAVISADGNRYIYIGRQGDANRIGSDMPDDSYYEAVMLAEQGGDPSPGGPIHRMTGWFFGPDKRWRTEISDNEAKLKQPAAAPAEAGKDPYRVLGDVLDHPALYKAYPDAAEAVRIRNVSPFDALFGTNGYFDGLEDTIGINPTLSLDDQLSTLLHEVQHYIQKQEGFARGGNSNTALDNIPNDKIVDIGQKVLKYLSTADRAAEVQLEAYKMMRGNPLFQVYKDANRAFMAAADKHPEAGHPERVEAYSKAREAEKDLWQYYFGTKNYFDVNKTDMRQLSDFIRDFNYQDIDKIIDRLSEEASKLRKKKADLSEYLSNRDPASIRNTIEDIPGLKYDAYLHLFGEVEARDVQLRQKYDDNERLYSTPYAGDQTIEPNDYIFVDQDGQTMSSRYMRKKRPPTEKEAEATAKAENLAGNINLDNFDLSDGAEAVIKLVGKEIPKTRISMEETRATAEAMGVNMKDVRDYAHENGAARLLAMRQVLARSAERTMRVAESIGNGDNSDLNLALFARYMAMHRSLQESVSKSVGNAGRTLRALREVAKTNDVNIETLRMMGKKTGMEHLGDRATLEETAKLLLQHKDNPAAQTKIAKDMYSPFWEDYLISFRYNMMLYNLGTHAVNLIGNTGSTYMDLIDRGFASIIGQMKRPFGSKDRTSAREVYARQMGLLQALTNSKTYTEAGQSFAQGRPLHQVSKVEVGSNLFSNKVGPAGISLEVPSRALAMSDSFSRSTIEQAALNGLAHRTALKEGLTGDAYKARVAELIESPTTGMKAQMDNEAAILQLVDEPSWMGQMLERLKQHPRRNQYGHRMARTALHMVAPFSRVSDRLFWAAVRRTPIVGFLDKVNQADFAAGGAQRDLVLGRMMTGALLIGYLVQKYNDGELSGSGPSDFRARGAQQAEGWQPNSIKFGDTWYSLRGADQVTPLVNMVAEFGDTVKDKDFQSEDEVTKAMSLVGAAANGMHQNTFLSQLSQLFGTMGKTGLAETNRENYISNMVSSFIPSGVRHSAELADGQQRDSSNDGTMTGKVKGAIERSVPGLREDLPQKYDPYGRPMRSQKNLLTIGQNVTEDKTMVVQEMKRLKAFNDDRPIVTPVARSDLKKVFGTGEVPAKIVQEYQKVSGEYIFQSLQENMATPEWQSMTDEEKVKFSKKIVEQMRKYAREDLFGGNPVGN